MASKKIILVISALSQSVYSQNAASLRASPLQPLPDEISVQSFANMVGEHGSNVLSITIMPQSGCSTALSSPPNNIILTGAEILSPSDELQSMLREGLKQFDHSDERPGAIVYYFCSNTKSFPKKLVAGKLGYQLNKQKSNLERFEGIKVRYQTRLLGGADNIDLDAMVNDALN